MKLTALEQRIGIEKLREYLRSPDECPFCGSLDLCNARVEEYDNYCEEKTKCQTCGEAWKDFYVLCAIVGDEEPQLPNVYERLKIE